MSNRSYFPQAVRISSWVGDALLTLLAVWLAIHNRDTLTVHLALALGLCVVLGGLLPVAVYFVDYLFAQNARQDAEARAPENFRAAMVRLDNLVRRVEDTAEGAAKSTLVARQIPERIEEKFNALAEMTERFQPDALVALANSVEQLTQRIGELPTDGEAAPGGTATAIDGEALRTISGQLADLAEARKSSVDSEGLIRFEAVVEALRKECAELRQAVETESLVRDEKLDTILERLDAFESVADDAEWAVDPLTEEVVISEDLADDWVDEPTDAPEHFLPVEDKEPAKPKDGQGSGKNADAKNEPTGKPAEEPEVVEPVAPKPAPKKRKKKKKSVPAPEPAADEPAKEMTLFAPDEIQASPIAEEIAADHGLLLVKAFVGISNRLFARGDSPLNWDEGFPLRPSGIGEWRLELNGLSEPLQVELRINDEVSALGELTTLSPGQPLSVSPRFPKP